MRLTGFGTPPTWTAEDGERHWSAKALYPARDTPRWLCVLLAVAIVYATITVFADAYRDESWLRLVFAVLVLGLNAVTYLARAVIAVQRP